MPTRININHLSDSALVAETQRVAGVARQATAELVALLAEVERRGGFRECWTFSPKGR